MKLHDIYVQYLLFAVIFCLFCKNTAMGQKLNDGFNETVA